MKSVLKIVALIFFVLIVIFGGFYYFSTKKSSITQNTPSKTTQTKDTLLVGSLIDENGLEADRASFQPFIDYLVSKLSDQGITKGQFVGTKSVSEMALLVKKGKIDVIVDSPFPVYVMNKLTGAQPIAVRWKNGVEVYHSAIFVKNDSPVKTLNDLKGKIISMALPNSTAGYFLPKAELIKRGYTLSLKDSPTAPVSPDEIGYFFAADKVYVNVTNGITAAGTENDVEIKDHYGNTFNNYRYIAITSDILRALVATTDQLDPGVINSIKKILFTMDQNDEGKKILVGFGHTAKFTPLASTDTPYGVVKDLTNLVQGEIVKP